jgi:hypothetical protein
MQMNNIIRILEHRPRADKSAVGAINRPLLSNRMMLFICIFGPRWMAHYPDEKAKKRFCQEE